MAWVDAGLDRGVLNFTIDSDGRVFSVSEYTLAQLGYGRDELVGQQADHLMVLEKPLVRDLMQARGCPGDKRFSPCSLWARDERLFRVLATFWWNANLSTWDFSADIVSIVPAPEPNTEPEQLPNVSQFARAMTVQFQPKLALDGVVFFSEDSSGAMSRSNVNLPEFELLKRIADRVEEIDHKLEVVQPLLREARERGPYKKPYGLDMRDLLIEDANDTYAKWLKIPSASRPRLLGYLARELGLKEWTLKRRLVEHGLRIEDLPWALAA